MLGKLVSKTSWLHKRFVTKIYQHVSKVAKNHSRQGKTIRIERIWIHHWKSNVFARKASWIVAAGSFNGSRRDSMRSKGLQNFRRINKHASFVSAILINSLVFLKLNGIVQWTFEFVSKWNYGIMGSIGLSHLDGIDLWVDPHECSLIYQCLLRRSQCESFVMLYLTLGRVSALQLHRWLLRWGL